MKFSIIFPTRERPELLKRLLYSIAAMTTNINNVEVLIAVDDDDVKTGTFFNDYSYSFVRVFFVKRSLNFSQDYYTFLTKQSTGKWVIALNDDGEFMTKGWDIQAEAHLLNFIGNGPNVVYGFIEDELGEFRAKGHGEYCCFPLLGRDGINAMDCFFPARIPTWGADLWARDLYDQVQRVIKLPITIKHWCYHNGTREADHINKRIMLNQIRFSMAPAYDEINKLINVLREARMANAS
jgi:glycosyltransferase involved in cell wall biosynthesis